MPLGDWVNYGLETYSGGATYHTQFSVDAHHLAHHAILDLGAVYTTAETHLNGKPLGITLTPPHHHDITDHLHPGTNQLSVTVYNTLANHYTTYPTRFVYPGQTTSGLHGPVTITFATPTTIHTHPTPI